jgi:hypothetical protein
VAAKKFGLFFIVWSYDPNLIRPVLTANQKNIREI